MRRTLRKDVLRASLGRTVTLVAALAAATAPTGASAARKQPNAPTIWVAPALMKVRPSQNAGTPGAVAQIGAARNEFEAFQIVVTGNASAVSAVASDLTLKSSGGTVLYAIHGSQPPAGVRPDVHLFRAATINLTRTSSSDPESATGPWPDALVPDRDELLDLQRKAFPFDVRSQSVAIWCEVFVPRDAPAGTYTGTVTVSYGNGGKVGVPVQLTVWGFSLPSTATLRSAYGLAWGSLPAGHAFSASDGATFTKIRHRYGQYALDHRVTLSHIDDGWSYADLNAFAASYGDLLDGTASTRLPGAHMTAVEYLRGQDDVAQLASWSGFFDAAAKAATHPWPGNVLFQYACDEPPATCAWTDIIVRANAAHSVTPPMPSLVTTDIRSATANPSSGLDAAQVLDLIVPVVNFMDDKGTSVYAGDQRSTYDAFLATTSVYTTSSSSTPVHTAIRRELWSYQSCMSHDCGGSSSAGTGWPSYMIDANAIRNRAMQWLLFEYGETGELYYETTHAYGGDAWSNQWAFTGNGDGNLFYPGTPSAIGGASGTDIPVASIRFKMIREGMEDYEYLAMLARYDTYVDASGAVQHISCSDVPGTFQSCQDYALAIARAVFPDMYTTNGSLDALMSSRTRMAHKLEALVAAYGQR